MNNSLREWTKEIEMQPERKMVRIFVFVVAMVLPFLAQKAYLDATRGGARPELSNGIDFQLLLCWLLLAAAFVFLPFTRLARFCLVLFLAPITLFAYCYFTVAYACDHYNHYCF